MQCVTFTKPILDFLRQYEWLRRIYRESRALYNVARNRGRAVLKGEIFPSQTKRSYYQSIPKHVLAIDGFHSAEQFCAELKKRNVHFATGRHTIYLPPQEGLEVIVGDVVRCYPPGTGFKVLKDFRPPDKARYITNGNIRRVIETLMGPVTNQALAANGLYALGLGPRCYGIEHLYNAAQNLTAFAVEHVDGATVTPEECVAFVKRLGEFVADGFFYVVPNRRLADPDFLPPHCNGNLLREKSTGRLQYVDFQQLLLHQPAILRRLAAEAAEVFHFGGTSTLVRRGRKHLYQSIPGLSADAKRDTQYRWERIRALLARHHISLEDRVVLDVCCNSGMMLCHALTAGAHWGIGFDLPQVVAQAARIMAVLGTGRTTLIPATLSPDTPLSSLIPRWLQAHWNRAIVLYLAAVEHVGIIADLGNIPWKALVFEGHQRETQAQVEKWLDDIRTRWNCSLAYQGSISDGDCGSRTLALFVRS